MMTRSSVLILSLIQTDPFLNKTRIHLLWTLISLLRLTAKQLTIVLLEGFECGFVL